MSFDAWLYTREALEKQLIAIELHGKDGSAVEGGCSCIEEKHIIAVEMLAEEAITFSKTEAEKRFYVYLADLARELRKKIDAEDWSISGGSHRCPPCPTCKGEHQH